MRFKQWLSEAGVGGGLTPDVQRPHLVAQGAFADFHDKENGSDPQNPKGQLPPVKKTTESLNKAYVRSKNYPTKNKSSN